VIFADLGARAKAKTPALSTAIEFGGTVILLMRLLLTVDILYPRLGAE